MVILYLQLIPPHGVWRCKLVLWQMGEGCRVIPPPANLPLIFHNKSPYDGLNKRRAPAAFVLSGADLNPTLIVSHYKEGDLWGVRRTTEYMARTYTRRNFQLTPKQLMMVKGMMTMMMEVVMAMMLSRMPWPTG